ncbi:lipopolysaccharide biosynthesis protein [Maribacter cobaltidurans]|uniref:Uncharacterized protein n=1 Tax=Maribacter cobaltidurans TaxID=1178778 RepID=A0A223V0K7_9FLAO|nr:lipopolysaccharide biosynthesis protein [Maribacter cobaltidurans]ASV28844.1 hypothetical protein CJ263_00575 [Maribacter cobaltidurans]GGD74346.1 lipopolysaccharide biosynthesis protein [Maribacter cobaltidurans]
MSLKVKAVNGFSWTFFEMLFSQGVVFIVGVILARILTPEDFGIIGIITAFLAVSNSIIEGGLGTALLRKLDANNVDFNTVFYTNLILGVALYFLLFFTSDYLAHFFEIPILSRIFKYAGLIMIINAFTIIHRTILTRDLNFKLLALISVVSSILSGVVAIFLAYNNYGVWSLLSLIILKPLINAILLWYYNQWWPGFQFSKQSFLNLFDYGYKVLLSGLINTIYKNIYYVIIGKFFSPSSLGYYTRAEQFQGPISGNITRSIGKISFPILSTFQNDKGKLKSGFIKFLKFSVFINFPVMLSIAGLAKPLILLLIGNKWETSIYYLQILCVSGMLYPLHILHLNLLLIKGYSNLQLKLEVIKKIILIPLIVISAFISIEAMLYGLVFFSIVELFINSFYTKKIINYSYLEQLKDTIPAILIATLTFLVIFSISLLKISLFYMLLLQVVSGLLVFILINEILKQEIYLEIRTKIIKFLSSISKS